MNENPYQSPHSSGVGSRDNGWFYDRPQWGRLALVWPFAYLFALTWLVGSALMYATLFGLWIYLKGTIPRAGSVPPPPYYDVAGITSFGPISLAALVAAVVLLVRRRAEIRQPWPNWRMVSRCLLWSTSIVAPAWALLAWFDGGIWYLPGEAAWIGICEVSLLGIIHGRVCQQGLRYHRSRLVAIDARHASVRKADVADAAGDEVGHRSE